MLRQVQNTAITLRREADVKKRIKDAKQRWVLVQSFGLLILGSIFTNRLPFGTKFILRKPSLLIRWFWSSEGRQNQHFTHTAVLFTFFSVNVVQNAHCVKLEIYKHLNKKCETPLLFWKYVLLLYVRNSFCPMVINVEWYYKLSFVSFHLEYIVVGLNHHVSHPDSV